MEVILLSKIKKLGDSGAVINVKSGYARNFLIPKGKAILANKKNIESFEAQRIALEKEKINELLIAQSRAEKLKKINSITILSKVGKEGKIFGSVGVRNIIKEIILLGIKINKKEIRLPNGLLRQVGEHIVVFQPHSKVSINFIVKIIAKN
ncbi:50S ribosomal protein L9 [Buchnera aphidicola str. APS (Acyrthosiphon pisum)]|uniref:Large ribosomal subunit protein bL9 n=3 Tax=Buchnera aphidicola TaxID=9 RepID=RL9_BUCAI|nr:50S ribosomal protein L9 [Buchnera aphidicola]B8D883.1 RecName: Full=Large ribosomal subunit protein bL9; AltName: Full=50S ribosomal protein L9 [Buchnera aphidicola str. Tuc7 (Acyrthosiphon pisum)]B8D8C6.1 RecName: Full=Large ribosomal subunit protein bL9; AltName: Full=50S ribosomal protein L9 [Buchnera aphidicola str. 5A (Acyrthosiphon pisum)]P57625.1 RecName: Full=Large ribosomal subunit protein bL9; AltName: Full=50S ribosomal protein L9 [Buchnera aphidicola str. APS (Acyrthosiphon pisum